MPDIEMRAAYAETLIALAERDPRIVLLEADLMRASGTGAFQKRFPQRTFNVGVAEANMVSIAAGLAAEGKVPFADTFACFAGRRDYDQFFISANYARLSVHLVGTDPGITATYNGGTHMPFEDLGNMRHIPYLTVFEPSDSVSLRALVARSAELDGCSYMRLHRRPVPALYPAGEEFELGKGKVLEDGRDVAIFAIGALMVHEALAARTLLAQDGVAAAVIDLHTLKPIDSELIVHFARKTGAVVTCENHQVRGGLGSAVAEVLGEFFPCRMKRIGVQDEFGEVGDLPYLQKRYGLTASDIRDTIKESLSRNGN